jgi:hypothetical protein
VSDSKGFSGGISNFDYRTANAVLMYLAAVATGSAPSTNINTLLTNGKDLAAYSEQELDRMLATLVYRGFVS